MQSQALFKNVVKEQGLLNKGKQLKYKFPNTEKLGDKVLQPELKLKHKQ